MLFAKYHGSGNDFILVDGRNLDVPFSKEKVLSLCHRQHGIGADGLILLEKGKRAKYKMRIFNADGTEAEMCGNGLRCLIAFIEQMELGRVDQIESSERFHRILWEENRPCISLGIPTEEKWHQKLMRDYHFVNTGVPHVVTFVEDLEEGNMMGLARTLRYHEAFAPHGTNVNFAKICEDGIQVRTYERGVEAETFSCGTGGAAVAYVSMFLEKNFQPVRIYYKNQPPLIYSMDLGEIFMQGPVEFVFNGEIKC